LEHTFQSFRLLKPLSSHRAHVGHFWTTEPTLELASSHSEPTLEPTLAPLKQPKTTSQHTSLESAFPLRSPLCRQHNLSVHFGAMELKLESLTTEPTLKLTSESTLSPLYNPPRSCINPLHITTHSTLWHHGQTSPTSEPTHN
jgi:hypothetical protein